MNPQEDLREIEKLKSYLTSEYDESLFVNIKNKINKIAERNKFKGGCGKRFKSNSQNMFVTCGGNIYNPIKEFCKDCQAKKKIQEKAKEVSG